MPRKIDNRELYLKLMSKSFYDKAWFLKNLPDDVETIVDFGGGAGEFAEFCAKITGNRVHYIVVDNDPQFLNVAKQRLWLDAFTSLTEAKKAKAFDPDTTLLVLSSVIHEVYAYADVKAFWREVKKCKFKYIAVRDMVYDYDSVNGLEDDNTFNDDQMMDVVKRIRSRFQKICPKQLKEFEAQEIEAEEGGFEKQLIVDKKDGTYNPKNLMHLMLKYRYKDNWAREVKENYLPLQTYELETILSELGYSCSAKNTNVKFLIDTWIKELGLENPKDGIDWNAVTWIKNLKTHVKCFATRW